MADIVSFLESKGTLARMKERQRLADWLRKVADHIERNEVETDPFCAVITLIGREQSEVLAIGKPDASTIAEAATTLFRHSVNPSGERSHSHYPRNFVQFLRDWKSAEALMATMKNQSSIERDQ